MCFKGAPENFVGLDAAGFPTASLRFSGNATLVLHPYRYLFMVGRGVYCLGVFDNGDMGALIGGIAVRNALVTVRFVAVFVFLFVVLLGLGCAGVCVCCVLALSPQHQQPQQPIQPKPNPNNPKTTNSTTPAPAASASSTPTAPASGQQRRQRRGGSQGLAS